MSCVERNRTVRAGSFAGLADGRYFGEVEGEGDVAEHGTREQETCLLKFLRLVVNLSRVRCNRRVMDDDELIASLAGGDDTALRELFSRHAPWLAARLRKALPPDDVEDVLQETFLAVWQNAKTYQPRGTPAAWLWVIARNQAALLLRKRGPAAQALLDEGGPVGRPRRGRARQDGPCRRRGGGARPARLPRPRGMAAAVRGRPAGRGGGGADGRPRGHGEEPRVPGAPPAARGAWRSPMNDRVRAEPEPRRGDDDVDLDRVWANVAAEVWRRHPGRLERTAARLLGSPGLARALLTTPSLLLPWLIGSTVVLAVGALAQVGAGQPLVWLIAPAVAAVGIAYSYGPGIDPAWELSCCCPSATGSCC